MGISVLSPLALFTLCLSGRRNRTRSTKTTRSPKTCTYSILESASAAMPSTGFDKSMLPPHFEQHHCPSCGLPMELLFIEATDDVDCEARVFECVTCMQTKTVKIRFRRIVDNYQW